MCVLVGITESAVIGAVLTATFKTFVMSAFMRIRQLIVELFVSTCPSIFIVVGQRWNDGNAQNQYDCCDE